VIGINIARSARVETLAIPAEAIQAVLADLKSGKLAPAGTQTVAAKDAPTVAEKVAKPKAAKQAEPEKGAADKKTLEAATPDKSDPSKLKKAGDKK
jgi:hypothetical protein